MALLPLAEMNRTWDASKAIKRVRDWAGGEKEKIDWNKYAKAFFYVDPEKKENFGGYKLPFADVIDGELKAVPRGIMAAAAAIQGARGGVNIPENVKEEIKKKIEKYYEAMDRVAPWIVDQAYFDVYISSLVEGQLNEVYFSEKEEEKWILVLPHREFYSDRYGKIKIDKDLTEKMVRNFKNGVLNYEPIVDIEHDRTLGRYGVVKDLKSDEKGLWALISLDEEGKTLVKKNKFKYVSAEYKEDYEDKETGDKLGPVFIGVALTNSPHHPDSPQIDFSDTVIRIYRDKEENGGENNMGTQDKNVQKKQVQDKEKKQVEMTDNAKDRKEKEVDMAEIERKLAEKEERIRNLERNLYEQKVEKELDDWLNKGIPPAIVEESRKVLNEIVGQDNIIQLSEDRKENIRDFVFSLVKRIVNKVPVIDYEQRGLIGFAERADKSEELVKDIVEANN